MKPKIFTQIDIKIMARNSEIVKEYDVKGKHPFSKIFDEKRKNKKWYQKLGDWFSVCWYAITMRYYETKRYFKNIVYFNKMMKDWYLWDSKSQLKLFAYGLEGLANHMERYGREIDVSRKKKIASIRRLVELLRTDYEDAVNDKYLSVGEDEVITHVTEYADGSTGFEVRDEDSKKIKEKSLEVYKEKYHQAREAYYDEIFKLIKGQDMYKLQDEVDTVAGEKHEDETYAEYQQRRDEIYHNLFDGTGIEGWWD